MRYVIWHEPGQAGKVITYRITEEEAIRRQRTKSGYSCDQEALLDFLTVNWAWLEETT